MNHPTNTKGLIEEALQAFAPALENAGNWLGQTINDGIDALVDFLTIKKR